MKSIHYLLPAALAFAACRPANEYTITGTLEEPFTGKVYLTCIHDRLTMLDSLTLEGANTFAFTGTIEHPDEYRIITSPRRCDASLLVEPGSSYRLTQTGDDATVEVVQGGKEQLLMQTYEQSMDSYRQRDRELTEAYRQVAPHSAEADSLQKLMSAAFEAREQATLDFIKQHPRTLTAVQLAGDLLLYTFPDLQGVYEVIDTVSYAHNHGYRNFKEKYDNARAHWLQGQPAPEFTTRDLSGKEVRLADFRGSYVLLDFWASWCHPCRTRAKELKGIYDQLQARGIQVCGISMDEKRAQWEAATKEDGIVWTNTGDVKPFKENAIAAAYKVVSLPTLFLIAPDGTIALQNPEIEDLLALPVQAK